MKHLKKILAIFMIVAIVVSCGVMYSDSLSMNVDAAGATGIGLCNYCLNAYNEGWDYVYGAMSYGAVDCSGLIMSYNGVGGDRTDLEGAAQANGLPTGPISCIPNVHGLGLHRPYHVGVYVGSGMEIDARGTGYGICYESVGNSWDTWYYIVGVSYTSDGWEYFDGNYFFYEDGEYLVNTSRSIDGVTYTFNSLGYSDGVPDDMSGTVDYTPSSRGNSNSNYNYDDDDYSYEESDTEDESEKESEEEKARKLEEEAKKAEEEAQKLAEDRLNESIQSSTVDFLAAVNNEDPYNSDENDGTLVINADASLLELKDSNNTNVPGETTVTREKAMNKPLEDIQTRNISNNRHPFVFVIILAATFLAGFVFLVIEKRLGTKRYAKASHAKYKK